MTDQVCYDTSEGTAVAPRVGNSLSRLLEGFWDYDFTASFDPGYEIRESDTEYRMIFEMPGVRKEDVKVNIMDGMLRLTGERKVPEMKKGETCCSSGLGYGKFERSFTLPDTVKEGEVHASFHDGLLELVIPKKEEEKRKAIEVKIE